MQINIVSKSMIMSIARIIVALTPQEAVTVLVFPMWLMEKIQVRARLKSLNGSFENLAEPKIYTFALLNRKMIFFSI